VRDHVGSPDGAAFEFLVFNINTSVDDINCDVLAVLFLVDEFSVHQGLALSDTVQSPGGFGLLDAHVIITVGLDNSVTLNKGDGGVLGDGTEGSKEKLDR